MKISVRGIYSTALIQFFIENNFQLSNLSYKQSLRFNILDRSLPDVFIHDTKDKTGIKVMGNSDEVINKFKEIFWDTFYIKKDSFYYVFFGYESKRILDSYRSKIVKTIENHHLYRRDFSKIVDFSEILDCDVSLKFKEYIVNILKEMKAIKRIHRKPDGNYLSYYEIIQDIRLIDGKIFIRTFRPIKSVGIYDGLGIPREEGDYAITEYLEGNWYFIISYYNKNHELKGKYININTPIEITKSIYYLDLAVDVVEVNNNRRVVDEDELTTYYKLGSITGKLYKKALEIKDELLK